MESFSDSEAYHDRAAQHFLCGRFDAAIELLTEGLRRFPDAFELYAEMGNIRMTRGEIAWAHQAFHQCLLLDPEHEYALLGYGETLLLLGHREEALRALHRVVDLGHTHDNFVMIEAATTLLENGLLLEAKPFLAHAYRAYPDSAAAAHGLGTVACRYGSSGEALYWLRRTLTIVPWEFRARIDLANLLYDRHERDAALVHFLRTRPEDHTNRLGLARVLGLLGRGEWSREKERMSLPWLCRALMLEFASMDDPLQFKVKGAQPVVDPVFTGQSGRSVESSWTPSGTDGIHMVDTLSGHTLAGTWEELVDQLQFLDAAWAPNTQDRFMTEWAWESLVEYGVSVPTTSAEAFVRGVAAAGRVLILA